MLIIMFDDKLAGPLPCEHCFLPSIVESLLSILIFFWRDSIVCFDIIIATYSDHEPPRPPPPPTSLPNFLLAREQSMHTGAAKDEDTQFGFGEADAPSPTPSGRTSPAPEAETAKGPRTMKLFDLASL